MTEKLYKPVAYIYAGQRDWRLHPVQHSACACSCTCIKTLFQIDNVEVPIYNIELLHLLQYAISSMNKIDI